MSHLVQVVIVAVGFWSLGVGFGWRARGAHKPKPEATVTQPGQLYPGTPTQARALTYLPPRGQGDDAY